MKSGKLVNELINYLEVKKILFSFKQLFIAVFVLKRAFKK